MITEQSAVYDGTVPPEIGSLIIGETAENNALSFTNTRKSARLTISKNVTGDLGVRSLMSQFSFTLMSVADEINGTTCAVEIREASGYYKPSR